MANKALLLSVALSSASVAFGAEALDALAGADLWGHRPAHPAVVNAVMGSDRDSVLSLRGEWDFTTYDRERFQEVPVRNGLWPKFFSRKWANARKILVPGSWESQGVGEPGMSECWDPKWDQSVKPIRHKFIGVGWYKKTVDIPDQWKDKRIWIKFGGVKSVAWVWVNDRQVAHIDTYCGTVKYEITDLVTPGRQAKVVVQVDNRVPSRKGMMSYMHRWGGIYRDVELEATPMTFVDDAWARGDFDKRIAQVKVKVGGECRGKNLSLRATVEGESVEVPLSASSSSYDLHLALRAFRPWSPERPNLYTARVELVSAEGRVIQTRWERFGVRKLEVVGREFRLNGKPCFLRGFGDDHVYPLHGLSPADRTFHRAHLSKARAAGFNFIRLHTHCEVPEYFEAADELGLLIQAELPYYSDVPTEAFAFDPRRDVTELHEHYRRHPSFAVYSMGNEGSFGDDLDRSLHRHVKQMDPDRLKINQDVHRLEQTTPDRSDYDGGPITTWPRGSHPATRPFVCHEYLNLSVKMDSRTEGKFTGVWRPPVTRADRARWLAKFGLDHTWGDRLQDAQHALQAVWQKRGIESARSDAGCGGYHFWTIADVVVFNKAADTYSAVGLFDPLWDEKPCGLTAAQFAVFNSASCVLADFQPSNSVFAAGDRLTADVLFAHFGDAAIADGMVEWRLKRTDGGVLASGMREVGPLVLGPARKIASLDVTVPDVDKPMRTAFAVSIRARDGSFTQSNEWPLWLFPKGPSRAEIVRDASSCGIVIAARDSPDAKAALAKGANLITIDGADGCSNVSLGWWWMGTQVGTAIKDHPAFGDFPHEGVMTPLWFRLIKDTGLKLSETEMTPSEMIVVGEGGADCFVYLAERRVGPSRVLECHGLDLQSDTPEGNALLAGFVRYLAGIKRDGRRGQDKEE